MVGSYESAIAHHLGNSVEIADAVLVASNDVVVVAFVITTGDVVYVVTATAFGFAFVSTSISSAAVVICLLLSFFCCSCCCCCS